MVQDKPKIEEEDEMIAANEKYVIKMVRKNTKLKLKLVAERVEGKYEVLFFCCGLGVYTNILCNFVSKE